ncbi:MAG: DUF58 domain-containing protein [Gammaproteobacteria bacterium]|nr:DUF58 domain-containing protein [Gammaproteobacteria bacterium]
MIDALRRRKAMAASTAGRTIGNVGEGDGVVRVSLASLLDLRRRSLGLDLRPRRISAPMSGSYVSPFKGRGMEFDEVRPYAQGDDVRTIDWRVTARSGKPHTKLFREERERSVLLWIDLRSAMFFATRGAFKSVRAAQVAASLGWRTHDLGDRLGALVFDETRHDELRPRRGQAAVLHLLRRLSGHEAWGRTERHADGHVSDQSLNQSLLRLRRVAQPGGAIFLVSDFNGFDEQAAAHIAQLGRHNDVVMIWIHDPLESELPPAGRYRVGDGRTFVSLDSRDPAKRATYHERFAEHRTGLETLARNHGIAFLPMSTADDPLTVLQRGLGVRG